MNDFNGAKPQKTAKVPQVSIGMPVYNGAKFIHEALDSLLAQTFTDFELIISDNASTDETEAICREYAKKDDRICYVRQVMNLGMTANFKFVFDKAKGEYFMWASHDDVWGPSFVENNYCFLRDNKDFVGSISESVNHLGDTGLLAGCSTINHESFQERIFKFMQNPASNSRMLSLFVRERISKINICDFNYIAGDWPFIIEILKIGKLNCVYGAVQFQKRAGISNNIVSYYDQYRTSSIEYIFPLRRLFMYILTLKVNFKIKISILLHILTINYSVVKSYFKTKTGNYLWDKLVVTSIKKGFEVNSTSNKTENIRAAIYYYLTCYKNRLRL